MKILFATDGAAPSARAGEMLARLADPARTQVVVMSVNDFDVAMREAKLAGHFSTEEGHAAARRAADHGPRSGCVKQASSRWRSRLRTARGA